MCHAEARQRAAEPLWSILIAHLGRREERFRRLLEVLLPQAEADGRVEVVCCHNNGEADLGAIRNHLVREARGEYVSFCDDDDMVADDYIAVIAPLLLDTPDIIGHQIAYFEAGRRVCTCYCSIRYDPHDEDINGTAGPVPDLSRLHRIWRDVTHIQPIRRGIALKGDFLARWPEDSGWREGVRPHVGTETCIDRELYVYYHDWRDSVQGAQPPEPPRPPVTVHSSAFRYTDLPPGSRRTLEPVPVPLVSHEGDHVTDSIRFARSDDS